MVREIKADDAVDIVVMRKGKRETIKDVKLPAARQQEQAQPRFQLPNLQLQQGFLPEAFGENMMMSIKQTNADFEIKFNENGVRYTISGTKDDGPTKASNIVIDDNGKEIKAKSIDQLDEQYRPTVEKLLKNVR